MPTSTAGRSNRAAGFTLLELALVLLLIGLFSSLVFPMLSGFGGHSLDASARRLAGSVKYLFNEAVLSGLEHRLIFDLDRGSYRAVRLEKDGELVTVGGTGSGRSLAGETRFKDLTLPGRGLFSAGEVTAYIYPSGWIDETVVHLDDRHGRLLTLRIEPLTGSSEVFEGYREF